jgi:hypothetical protein
MNYRAHTYRVPNVQPRRANFYSRNSQLRSFPHYLQSRAGYQTHDDRVEQWETGWRYTNIIRSVIGWIIKIVHFIQSRIHEQAGAGGSVCSPACVCVGAAVTTTCVVASTALGVGLSVALNPNSESLNSTLSITTTVPLTTTTPPSSTWPSG